MKFKYITKNSKICNGTPIFRNTRIPIYIILDFLSAGETIENILENYPDLTNEHITEALEYAAELLEYTEELIEISS